MGIFRLCTALAQRRELESVVKGRGRGRTSAGRDLDNVAAAQLDLGDLVRRHALRALRRRDCVSSAQRREYEGG